MGNCGAKHQGAVGEAPAQAEPHGEAECGEMQAEPGRAASEPSEAAGDGAPGPAPLSGRHWPVGPELGSMRLGSMRSMVSFDSSDEDSSTSEGEDEVKKERERAAGPRWLVAAPSGGDGGGGAEATRRPRIARPRRSRSNMTKLTAVALREMSLAADNVATPPSTPRGQAPPQRCPRTV